MKAQRTIVPVFKQAELAESNAKNQGIRFTLISRGWLQRAVVTLVGRSIRAAHGGSRLFYYRKEQDAHRQEMAKIKAKFDSFR